MNNKGRTNPIMWILAIGVLVVIGLLTAFIFGITPQQVGVGLDDGDSGKASTSLVGKSASLTVDAEDKSADDVTTRRAVPIYVQNPDGDWIQTGQSSTTSSGSSTAVTSGITVSNDPYVVLAFNTTYGSTNAGTEVLIDNEAPDVNVPVFTRADHLEVTLYDADDTALSRVSANLSLSAGETNNFNRLKVKVNQTNTAFYWYGVYFDIADNTNVSTIVLKDGDVSFENNGNSGTLPLESISVDDKNFKLTAPQYMTEFDEKNTGNVVVSASGNDVATESYTLYIADGSYYFSSQGQGVQFGAENDATAPSDIGMTNPSISGTFT